MSEGQQTTPIDERQQEVIELLQITIELLNGIVDQLSTESTENLPPREMLETLVSNTQVLAELFAETGSKNAQVNPQAAESATLSDSDTSGADLLDELFFDEEDIDSGEPTEPVKVDLLPSPGITQEDGSGNRLKLLDSIGSILPSSISDRLSLWAILGIVALVVVGVIAVSVFVFWQSPAKIGETLPSSPTPGPSIEAPGIAQPVELAPPPKPELTPEQSLIAAIQSEIEDITRQYPNTLITTIEANFPASRLIITLGDDWNELNSSRQQNLANGILKRSRRLDFRKLELIDRNGKLLARSPVVGAEMIVFSP